MSSLPRSVANLRHAPRQKAVNFRQTFSEHFADLLTPAYKNIMHAGHLPPSITQTCRAATQTDCSSLLQPNKRSAASPPGPPPLMPSTSTPSPPTYLDFHTPLPSHLLTSSRRSCEAICPMSSGTSSGSSSTPSKPTAALNPVVAHASAEIRHPVVVSATSVTPYPGLRPLAAPLTWATQERTKCGTNEVWKAQQRGQGRFVTKP
eukprot:365252-Chlamydomonas_euryale.AAC.48